MKVWSVKKLDKQLAGSIKGEYGLPNLLATLFAVRGITTKEQIEEYFSNKYIFIRYVCKYRYIFLIY